MTNSERQEFRSLLLGEFPGCPGSCVHAASEMWKAGKKLWAWQLTRKEEYYYCLEPSCWALVCSKCKDSIGGHIGGFVRCRLHQRKLEK